MSYDTDLFPVYTSEVFFGVLHILMKEIDFALFLILYSIIDDNTIFGR